MLKRMGRALEKWGHYPLALLCAGVIVFSALWTRSQTLPDPPPGTAVLSDESQRLAEVTAAPASFFLPCAGVPVQGYSDAPVYFEQTGVWHVHAGLDFDAAAGENVYAMAAGTVLEDPEGVAVDQGEGVVIRYRGLASAAVQPGQRVKAGSVIGTAGGWVPFEGSHLCIMALQNGEPWDFSEALVDRRNK